MKHLIVICAYNEAPGLVHLLEQARKHGPILLVDDGSTDGTKFLTDSEGLSIIRHPQRMGKPFSLNEGVEFARENGYDLVLLLDGDTFPEPFAYEELIYPLEDPKIGGSTCHQIPERSGGSWLAYRIDELIWAILAESKRWQVRVSGSCYIGSVMCAFRPQAIGTIAGLINDDEAVDLYLQSSGYAVAFAEGAICHFDASISLEHIFNRRKRMYLGHLLFLESRAPSMNRRLQFLALFSAVKNRRSRLAFVLPALGIEALARFAAIHDRPNYLKYVRFYSRRKGRLNISSFSGGN